MANWRRYGPLWAGRGTWANKPAANAVPAGTLYDATDVGDNGTTYQSNGTRWRVLNGVATLKVLSAASANIANSETIVLQTLLPIGSWQQYDRIRLQGIGLSKSGTTDSGSLTVRVGTAGTTADTAITGISALSMLAAAQQSGGYDLEVKLLTATSAQKQGFAGGGSSFAGSGSTAAAAATTITDASANPLYVSVGIASSGATNTVALLSGQIQLLTP